MNNKNEHGHSMQLLGNPNVIPCTDIQFFMHFGGNEDGQAHIFDLNILEENVMTLQ